MTVAKKKTSFCKKCQGKQYVLTISQGKMRAGFCECFNCDSCNGEGRIYVEDENGVSSVKDCECKSFEKSLKKLDQVGIPGKYVGTWLETYHPDEGTQKLALLKSKDFLKDFGKTNKGLIFMGRPGVGKTHLAVSIIKALSIEKDIDCKFVDFFQLLSDIRNGFSEGESEQALINPFIKSRVLVIDELAKGRNTDWELTILDQIISQRYNDADKVTIFTSNYLNEDSNETSGKSNNGSMGGYVDTNSDEHRKKLWGGESLQEKIGPRIYSRLVEVCQFIKIEGKDFRQEINSRS
jgi:DNA replication protein DnaC